MMELDDNFDESWVSNVQDNISHSININENLIEDTILQPIIEDNISLNCKKMLENFKKRGIQLQGIKDNDIIEKWEDIFRLNNSNKIYISNLIKSIKKFGYFTPRPIQCITVGLINRGNDLVAQAVAGNGKTAAFVIGALTRIELDLYKPQILILSPTHELTDQTSEIVKNLTLHTGLIIHTYRGGLRFQLRKNNVPQIIVACPGKLEDLINRNLIDLNYLKTLILDEGDELLKRGFKDQVKKIIESIIDSVQICMFSATFSKNILEMCSKIMHNPAYVILPDDQVMTQLVSQWYINVDNSENKLEMLINIIKSNIEKNIIIFFNLCSKLIMVSNELTKLNMKHYAIHGRLNTEVRLNQLNEFISSSFKKNTELENTKSNILLASDLAARGLDIQHVTLIINFDVPTSIETYIHRIGRAGRGDTLGNALTMVISEEDKNKLKYIVQIHSMPIKLLKNFNFKN